MIIEIRKGLKSVGWFWYFIAAMFIVPQLINGIRMFRAKIDSAATVNGIPIKFKEFRRMKQSHESYIKNLISVGLGQFARPMSDAQILNSCAQEVLEQGVADKVGIDVGGEKLAQEVSKGLARHSLGKDGVLDYRRYASSVMASAGMSVADYEENQMKNMRTDALHDLVKACSYNPEFSSKHVAEVKARDKKFKIIEMPLDKFIDVVKKEDIPAEQLELFYRENLSNYMTTPERTVSYAFMDRDIFKEMASPEDYELVDYYDRHMSDKFSSPEKFSASYAWVEFDSEESKKQAEITLELLAQEVASSGKKLGQLASKKSEVKTDSKTLFSVAQGVLPYALETELQDKREVGAVTKPVEASGKIYIAQIDDHKPFAIKPFDQVKQELIELVSKTKIDDLIRDEVEAMIREVREMENGPEILDREVEKLSLKKKSLHFDQNDNPKGELESELFKLAFNKNVYEGHLGYVSRKDGLVVFVVSEVVPAKAIPFDKVDGQVKKDFLEKRARSAQEDAVEKMRQKVLAGQEIDAELDHWRLKRSTSEWVSNGEKDIRGFDFGPKMIDEFMAMDRPEQVFKHRAGDTFFLVSIAEQKPEAGEIDEKAHNFDDFRSSRESLDGFIACLLKDAKIVPNKGMLSDLIPEF